MKENIKQLIKMQGKKIAMYIASLLVLAVLYYLFISVLSFAPEFSGLPYALTKALLGVITVKLIDELMLYEVDTMQILKNNATAYSIYIAAYALIVALAIAGA